MIDDMQLYYGFDNTKINLYIFKKLRMHPYRRFKILKRGTLLRNALQNFLDDCLIKSYWGSFSPNRRGH